MVPVPVGAGLWLSSVGATIDVLVIVLGPLSVGFGGCVVSVGAVGLGMELVGELFVPVRVVVPAEVEVASVVVFVVVLFVYFVDVLVLDVVFVPSSSSSSSCLSLLYSIFTPVELAHTTGNSNVATLTKAT